MPKRSRVTFDEGQKRLLWKTAHDVYEEQFKHKDAPQKKMGLALGITQTTVSALLRRKYTPSVHVAEQLSMLAGHEELEDLIGPYFLPSVGDAEVPSARKVTYPHLRTCLDFHGRERWKPWTVAAAEAGFFGSEDVAPAEWERRLDQLEAKLSKK